MSTDNFEIRVRGRLGKGELSLFEDFVAEAEPAETVLRGVVDDQAALHGLLEQIQGLGLELVEVRRIGGVAEAVGGARTA